MTAAIGRGGRATALAVAVAAAGVPVVARAQPAEAPPAPAGRSPWKSTIELAGSLFIGNEPQSVLTTRGRTSHADSTFELSGDVRFVYGEGSQEGSRAVSQRLWFGSVNLDLWPFASHSPFLLGTVESSLARRVDLRVSAGVGHKMTFVDSERALANLSIALLGERSRLPTAAGGQLTESLARLSTRVRLRRKIGTRAELGYESYFRPELESVTRYTFTNSASATYAMTERLDLKLTYLDNYDSEARGRGARSNYDGQVVVGVAADF